MMAKSKQEINRIKKVNETVKGLFKKDKNKNKGKKGKNEEKKDNLHEISNK